MFRTIREYFQGIALLPSNLQQSITNPIQQDRLLDISRVETEFPVASGSLPENRSLTRKQLLFTALCCLPIAVVANFNFYLSIEFVLGFIAAAALVIFAISWIGYPSRWWHWPFYAFVLPPIALSVALLREPLLITLVGCWCAIAVANRFACHLFHLQTTAPMDRPRALQLRDLWHKRWFWNTARGLEFFSLITLGLLAFPILLWKQMSGPPSGVPWANVPVLAAGVAALLVLPWIVELLAGFLYARPWIPLRDMLAAFRAAIVQWYTYNLNDVRAAGAYHPPAGNCKQRRRMTFWLLILFTAGFGQLFSHGLDSENMLYRNQPNPHRTFWDKMHDLNPREWYPWQTSTSTETIRGQSPNEVVPNLRITLVAQKLEPYQEKRLQRMPPEEREPYLKRLREREEQEAQASKKEPEQEGTPASAADMGDPDTPEKTRDQIGAKFLWIGLYYVFMALFLASYPVLAVGFPFLIVGGYCFATTGRIAGYFRQNSDVDPKDVLSSERWEELVSRVQHSEDKDEKESLLLGVNASDNTPILVPLKVFEEHAHLIGDSGSGKTSLGISLILSQMARFKDKSVVVIDLKGDDLALFSGTRLDAERAGKPFRWFTNELGRSTYVFNPMTQAFMAGLSLYQKTDVITTALGLQYGTDYGRGYFSDANAELLFNALKEQPDIDSFRALDRLLNDRYAMRMVSNQLFKDGSHIRSIVSRLASTEALNATAQSGTPETALEQRIDFADVFRTPQVVHLHLPSSLGTTSSAEIARIALYSLLGAARNVPDRERKQVFVFIDEFQRIVAGNLELILQTARSMKVGLILANQSMYDLKRQGIDLMPAVRANTRYKQIFAASNVEDQQELIALSGQTLVHQRSWRESLSLLFGGATAVNFSEHVLPRLGVNDILLATDHPLQSVVQIRRGAVYAQYGGFPFVMRSTHHISADEYDERKNAAWPDSNGGTMVSSGTPAPRPDGSPSKSRKTVVDSKLPLENVDDPLQQLWGEQVANRKKRKPKP